MLSKHCRDIAKKYGIKVDGVNELVQNLGNKSKYVDHYRNLQLYLSLGMKSTKIHRVLKFKQSNWFKTYIDFNTEKRENAVNNFEKQFFKQMINSVYSKTMENLRKRINVRLVNNARNYKKYVSKPSFVSQKIFSKDLVAIHEIKPVLTLDKPIYIGFSILDLSKLFRYDYHYNYIKRKFDAKLLFTDTDSLTYEIKAEDIFGIFDKDKDLFDFSNYPKDSKFYDLSNMNEIGKMKDESKGKINIEFIGLKSKMYYLIDVDGKENKRGKGVNSVVVENTKHE